MKTIQIFNDFTCWLVWNERMLAHWTQVSDRCPLGYLFHFVNIVIFRLLCIDSGYLVSTPPHTILYQSFWNFAHVFSMVWRCACGLDIILALIFITFSTLWTLSFSDLKIPLKFIDSGYLVDCSSSYSFIPIFLKLRTCFLQCLEMCIWFGYNTNCWIWEQRKGFEIKQGL